MKLPKFIYHPDPVSTGAVANSEEECECCGEKNGYAYTSNLYCSDEVETVCPWCIANGSAAKKFEGLFSDDYPLRKAGISQSIIEEVTQRTPGFHCWQQEEWQTCCDDACEFHGDATKLEVANLSNTELREIFTDNDLDNDSLSQVAQHYQPQGSPAIYRWICRHCKTVKYSADFM